MSYLTLARRYRPGDFDNILSQHHVTTTLKNAVRLGRISHAYLFCGPRGTGKTTTARVLAKALNCQNGPTPQPCGQCSSCKEIAEGFSPDVFEIDAASNRGIDDIRELRENVRYAPIGGKYKVYIIDEVHRLTKEAFDALLKTLEEPPAHVIFIFATTEPQALPPTILSRTQRYDFKRIPVSSLAEAVSSVAQKEGLSIDRNAALLVAKKADGSFRDALSLLDQLSSFAEGTIDAARAAEIMGLVKTELLASLADSVIRHESKEALDLLGDFLKSGGDAQEMADALAGYFRTLMLIKNGVEDAELLELDSTELDAAKGLVTETDLVDLLRYFTALADYKTAVKQGQNPVFSLEAALVRMCSMDRAVSLEALLKKLPDSSSGTIEKASSGGNSALVSSGPGLNPSRRPFQQPAAGWKRARGKVSDVAPAPRADGAVTIEHFQANWNGFREYVSKRNKTTFASVSVCKPSRFEGGTLILSLERSNRYHFEQLSRPGKKEFLETCLKDYFRTPIRVNLVESDESMAAPSATATQKNVDEMFEGAPAARKLFDLLGGEIIGE